MRNALSMLILSVCAVSMYAAKEVYIPKGWSYDSSTKEYYEASSGLYWSVANRSLENDDIIILWDSRYGTTAPNKLSSSDALYVDINDLLTKAQSFYDLECNTLGFVDPQTSNLSKYKVMILLNYTEDWVCYGGGYDFQVPALWLSPSTCHPVGSAVAHEVGHSFHYMCYAEDSNHGANSSIQTGFHGAVGNGAAIWETTANWQALQSYPNEIFTESGTADIFSKSHNYAFTHEWHRYQAYMFLFYLCQKYNDIKTVANIWNHRETSVKDFNQVLMDQKGLSVSELYKLHFDFAMHAATWDLNACKNYGYRNYIGQFRWNCIKVADKTSTQSATYQVAYSSCPQSTGFNVIELNVPSAGTTVTTNLTALVPGGSLATNDPATYLNDASTYASSGATKYNSMTDTRKGYRGFRAGYVFYLSNGSRVYYDDNTVHCTGTGKTTEQISYTVPSNVSRIFLVVSPTPTSYFQHQWDESITNDDQWPYQVSFEGTTLKTSSSYISVTNGAEVTDDNLEEDGFHYSVTSYDGYYYEGMQLAIDQTAILNEIGASSLSDCTIYAENADGSRTVELLGGTDGWRDASGSFKTYGDGTYFYVKFDPTKTTNPDFEVYEIGGFPGMTHDGDEFTAKYVYVNNSTQKEANLFITLIYVKAPEVVLPISEKVIELAVEYENTANSYTEKTLTLNDEQKSEIFNELGIESLSTANIYGYNPTTKELISSYTSYDGWRNATGDFQNWSGNNTVPACVKILDDGATYNCYNIQGCDPQTIPCYWAIANEEKAMLVRIDFTYVYTLSPIVMQEFDINVNYPANTNYDSAGGVVTASFDTATICALLGTESMDAVNTYIVNVTDSKFLANTTDGWRDANGDRGEWGAENGMCVKITDPASGSIDYIGSVVLTHNEGESYTAKWGFYNPANNYAVVLNIHISFVAPSVSGDVNRDGSVTIADVTALVDIILGKDSEEPYAYDHMAADVNGDGSITIADVTALVDVILGK